MRSMFAVAPFKKFDLGTHAMGQGAAAFSITDYLDKIGLNESDLDQIQDPKFRAEYKAEYQKCVAKGLDTADGITCLAALGAKVYATLRTQGETTAKMPVPAVVTKPSEFPWVPVAIGGLAAAGLVAYLATRGK